ncbi:MAG: hypothetical protein WDO74_15745 [Pseudomonadota bacterium]
MLVDPDGDGDNKDYYEIQINPQNLVFDSQFDAYNEPKVEPDGPLRSSRMVGDLKSAVTLDGTVDKSNGRRSRLHRRGPRALEVLRKSAQVAARSRLLLAASTSTP